MKNQMAQATSSIGWVVLKRGLMLSLVLVTIAPVVIDAAEPRSPKVEVVSNDVIQALKTNEYVSVVVMLISPPSLKQGSKDSVQVRSDIAQLHDAVLATLSAAEFELKTRYENVPAIAGRLNAAGLAKLTVDSRVIRVDLDVGGSGAADQSKDDTKKESGGL